MKKILNLTGNRLDIQVNGIVKAIPPRGFVTVSDVDFEASRTDITRIKNSGMISVEEEGNPYINKRG